MTQEQTIATIRAEIERMHQEAVLTAIGNETEWLRSRIGTLVDIMAFFSTFEADHTPLPEDTVLFNKGVAEGRRLAEEEQADLFTIVALDAAQRAKEQMLKEAVEGEVVQDLKGVNRVKSFGKIPEGLHFGDKVRIIIVKD